jgi:hypothetical protein
MLKSKKSQVTCSFCSKIYKDPIVLPCGDSICREHLHERNVVKHNKIKCKKCNDEFGVKNNEFKSNNELKHSIESHSHLSDEEQRLKQELEQSIRQFFVFYDEFIQNRTKLASNVFDHYHEMRFQIDEHREELKVRIDDIALAMIDKIKKYEKIYLKELNENFPSLDDDVSLEKKLNEIEELFRNPNLLIESIKEMQQRQDESLNDIQSKLDQMAKVNDILEATNKFKPNLSLFKQEGDIGSIRLNEYSNMNSFKSEILKDEKQCFELLNLCEFSPNDSWSLLYRGTRDGFGSLDFHTKCDGHSNTLTILKAKESEFIFGGYTTVKWESSTNGKWKSDTNAFIFSLANGDKWALKMKVDPNKRQYALYCHSECGPSFGFDINIANDSNTTMKSYSTLGFSFNHPQYAYGTIEAQQFLAGSNPFKLAEIEVYKIE